MSHHTILAHNASRFMGGAELWTVRLLSSLQERGHRVVFVCRDRTMAAEIRDRGLDAVPLHLGGQVMLPDAFRFARLVARYAPDGVLLTTFKKIWLAGWGCHLARVPRVVARIGMSTDLPSRSWTYRVALDRWVTRTVVNADEIRLPFLAEAPGLEPSAVITIYNGVEAPRRSGTARVRSELGLDERARIVGTVARLNVQKRLDRLVGMLALLPEEVHAVVAGEGPDRASLEEAARAAGVTGRFHLLGRREDVGDVLAAMEVFLLTSDREGMSNAMLEALASGVPVVTTPVSGAREALEPLAGGDAPGIVVPPEADALAAAVRSILDDPATAAAMSEAGRRRARERFDYEQKVSAWEALLAGDPWSVRHEGPSPLVPPAPPVKATS